MSSEIYDLLVLGNGVAGAAAASIAARLGRRVGLLARGPADRGSGWVDWLHPQAAAPLKEAGVPLADVAGSEIAAIAFHSDDLRRRAEGPRIEGVHVAELGALRRALRDAARTAGVDLIASAEASDVQCEEESVRAICTGGRELVGRLLVVADGADSSIAGRLGVRDPRQRPVHYTSAQAVFGPAAGKGRSEPARLQVVLETARPMGFGYVLTIGKRCAVGLVEPMAAEEMDNRLKAFAARCAAAELLPKGTALDDTEIRRRRTPRGTALDYETHVGKRSLVIGDAGGFVSALSQDGLYPALVTAECAAKAADAALRERHAQDALQMFDALWRARLADQLRLPGTDLKFLTPMVFTNATMATRMARAFLLGDNL